jgi:hypothetical protein
MPWESAGDYAKYRSMLLINTQFLLKYMGNTLKTIVPRYVGRYHDEDLGVEGKIISESILGK